MIHKRRLVSLLTLVVVALTGCESTDSVRDEFYAPPKEVQPMVRWWWPGAAVDQKELVREIELLDANGFGGAEIQSLFPNFVRMSKSELAVVNEYAEPRFFELVEVAGKAAAEREMHLDYTFGSSWPSGGGFAITPEKALVELTMAYTQVQGEHEGPIEVKIPERTKRFGALNALDQRTQDPKVADWHERLKAREKVVAVIAVRGSAPDLMESRSQSGFELFPWKYVLKPGRLDIGSTLVLTDKLNKEGVLNWDPPEGKWQVFVFKQFAVDSGVLGAAGKGPQLVLDHMDEDAFSAHADRVVKPLGNNPDGLRALFVDSLELMQDIPWTENFVKEFERLRGYDITPYLPFVLQTGWMQAWDEHYSPPYFQAGSDMGERVREDYRETVSDLMFENFIEPFISLSHEYGLQAKFQAHGGAIDIVRAYGSVDIAETEDLVHGGDPFMMRLARSGANLYGGNLVSAESLVWKDRPYDVTPDEMRKRVDLIISGGANSLVLHGMNYEFHTEQWPGWHTFQPSPFATGFSGMLNETNPIWPAIKPLSTYIGRLQTIMQAGEPVVPIAYFYGRKGYYVGIESKGEGDQAVEKQLLFNGYDYDRINPHSIHQARVTDGRLVAKSGTAYAALVIPPIESMAAETAEKIAEFSKAGLKVYFIDHLPERSVGLHEASSRGKRVEDAVETAINHGAKVIPEKDLTKALREEAVQFNLMFDNEAPSSIFFVQRKIGNRVFTFLRNDNTTNEEVSFSLPGVGSVTRWNALDGSVDLVDASVSGGNTRVALELAGQESALLAQDLSGQPVSVSKPKVIKRVELASTGWTLAVEGYRKRSPYRDKFMDVTLVDWREIPELINFSGQGKYERSFELDKELVLDDNRLILSLDGVYDVAEVSVNGRPVTLMFTDPYKTDITDWVQQGRNKIEIEIYNTPQNAMSGVDAAGYRSLQPVKSGLIGPVTLLVVSSARN